MRLRVVLAGLILVVTGACRAEVELDVGARPDGGGRVRTTVTLDADAASQLPALASQLRVEDLREAGWEVEGPTAGKDGGTVIGATKRFGSPAELEQVMTELTGPEGPFRDLRIEQERDFLRTRTTFRGTVDLTGGLDRFSDEDLRARLGGSVMGLTPEQLEGRLGDSPEDVFGFRVVARLPGHTRANGAGGLAVWQPRLGDQLTLEASAERLNRANIALGITSLGAGTALLALLGLRLVSRGRTRAVSWS